MMVWPAAVMNLPRQLLPTALLFVAAACSPPPTRWEGAGGPDAAARDEANCTAVAQEEAARQLPYGDGPPIYGLSSNWSMLTWKQEIDNERYYLARDLTRVCMRNRGYQLVPVAGPAKA